MDDERAEIAEPQLLTVNLAPSLNQAFHVNAIPLIRDLVINAPAESELRNLVLTMETDPPFARPAIWHIDSVPAGGSRRVVRCDTVLEATFLSNLQEATNACVTFILKEDEREISHEPVNLRLLACDEWGGLGNLPEILGAFVRPNDPAVETINKRAAEILRSRGKSSGLDGYQSGKREKAWEIVSALWASVVELRLDYSVPAASFEATGQKIRSPGRIIEKRLVTCLDLALLFASCIEQAGLNPLIVLLKGHALVGAWLVPIDFSSTVVDDPQTLRKRVALGELILFETTLVTHSPAPGLRAGCDRGAETVSAGNENSFELAIDVHRARAKRILPLPEHGAPAGREEQSTHVETPYVFDEAPVLPDIVERESLPEQRDQRLERWKRRLLDLSLTNPLLNFRAKRRSIPFDCPDPGAIEDSLASDNVLRVVPRPDVMQGSDPRDASTYRDRHQEDAGRAHALEALGRNEILAQVAPKELDDRLLDLYRTARTALEDGGSNILFLALGFLVWRREDRDAHSRAPLLLIPVALERRSARSPFTLRLHDDEPRFNLTLLEMLRQDYSLAIPGVEGELPRDAAGLDVAEVWRRVRLAVRDVKGWEVEEEVVLSTFSFAKYLMWKDLCDRTELLKRNPVVKHLIETPHLPYRSDEPFPDPATLDDTIDPGEMFCPLEADSSQLAAAIAAAKGKSFVLVGPPGTGKSQTIANMIAQVLAAGKTVLFVSEKMAALDVVYRRLRAIGLGEFCLELHSAKARKEDVLEQLRTALNASQRGDRETWQREAGKLKSIRDQLNSYVRVLHHRYPNGLTPYQAFGRVVKGLGVPRLELHWADPTAHSAAWLDHARQVVDRLSVNARSVRPHTNPDLSMVGRAEWSPSWQKDFVDAARGLGRAARDCASALASFEEAIGHRFGGSAERAMAAVVLAGMLSEAEGRAFGLAADAEASLAALEAAIRLLSARNMRVASLTVRYKRRATEIDLDDLKLQWQRASAAWAVKRNLAHRKVKKALAEVAEEVPSKPLEDIETLIGIRRIEEELAQLDPLAASAGELWKGVETDVGLLNRTIEWCRRARNVVATLAPDPAGHSALLASITRAISMPEHIRPDGLVGRTAARLRDAHGQLASAQDAVRDVAVVQSFSGAENHPEWPECFVRLAERWIADAARLKGWCAWRAACEEAERAGLHSLVKAVEEGDLAPDDIEEAFEVNYCRWWSEEIIEREATLRTFVPIEHERRISHFREAERLFLSLTQQYVRSVLCGFLPNSDEMGKEPEWGLLQRELAKKKRHMALRQLVAGMPKTLTRLTPCLLMSPLSVAQYLPAQGQPFDVVFLDEASQITVWDAVGAIARAKQVVVVGDPKQLPPTSFFDRANEDFDDDVDAQNDLESILDEMMGDGLPTWRLRWHYRSRHESLIAFSNHRYYGGELITFPSAETEDRAVSYHHVADGYYERGAGRVNRAEATAVVKGVVDHLNRQSTPETARSIGIVTFNSEQQKLIEDLLEIERRKAPEFEPFFAANSVEPVIVKNLENVQGDERDVIFFSIGYGPDEGGRVTANFGPLNRDGGERRLNVAITRARRELRVFATLRAEQIDLARTAALGVRDLRHFLEFAERGPRALAESIVAIGDDYESPFEQAVGEALLERGWIIRLQVGVSGFRIDIGVVHPDFPGIFLAGVECDGAAYHRSATARDRDRLREMILRGLGWEIFRVWSTNWWNDPKQGIEILHDQLTQALVASRASRATAVTAETVTEIELESPIHSELPQNPPPVVIVAEEPPERGFTEQTSLLSLIEKQACGSEIYARNAPSGPAPAEVYTVADIAVLGLPVRPDGFFDPDYSTPLQRMIAHVISVEGPIMDDVLVRRLARAHGFKRSGQRIRERVLNLIPDDIARTLEEEHSFFWPAGSDTTIAQFRRSSEDDPRGADEIALPELIALAREMREIEDEGERLSAMARAMGLSRLREATRQRLATALRLASE